MIVVDIKMPALITTNPISHVEAIIYRHLILTTQNLVTKKTQKCTCTYADQSGYMKTTHYTRLFLSFT